MSGAELIVVISVAASAAQVIDYSLKAISMISRIYDRVKDAQKRIARYTTLINLIIAACRAIRESKDLNTPLINDQLKSTSKELEQVTQLLKGIHKDRTAGSKGRRVWKTILGNEEKVIVTCFERLETEKTSLIVCINVIQTQLLNNIGHSVDILVERGLGNPFKDIFETLKGKRDKRKVEASAISSLEMETAKTTSNSKVKRHPKKADSGSQQQEQIPKTKTSTTGQTFENMKVIDSATQYNGDADQAVGGSHSYDGLKSGDKGIQLNGNNNCGGGVATHKHANAIASGSSIQHNGNSGSSTVDRYSSQRAGKE